MAGISLESIANQNFAPGDDYLLSIANQARKAYCTFVDINESVPDVVDIVPAPLKALQQELVRRVCELPQDPVPQRPPNRLPSNAGSCVCLPYRIKGFYQESGGPQISFTNEVYGPVTPYSRKIGNPPNVQDSVGYTHRGNFGGGCLPTLQDNIVRQQNVGLGLRMTVVSIEPYAPNPPAPVDCQRPTLPTDRTVTQPRLPSPSINIPRIDLPDINIPVLPVPLPIGPGISFEPKLVIDVGGINISFTMGDVEFSFNPQIDAPITFFPPGYKQPTLPPGVEPLPSKNSKDCCDEIFKRFNTVDSNLFKVDLATQGIKDDTQNIKTVQNASVVPLLKDIQECVCDPDAQLFQTFTNVRGCIFPAGEEEISFAVVRLAGNLNDRRTFEVPGGETVSMVGYCSFGVSGRWGERIPLQYRDNIVKAPGRGYNQFTASFIDLGTGNVQIFTYKKE